jgi:hypothetical protein
LLRSNAFAAPAFPVFGAALPGSSAAGPMPGTAPLRRANAVTNKGGRKRKSHRRRSHRKSRKATRSSRRR